MTLFYEGDFCRLDLSFALGDFSLTEIVLHLFMGLECLTFFEAFIGRDVDLALAFNYVT